MKLENYVCYKDKYDKIQSLGVEIDSLLLNDERSLNNSNNMIGGGKGKNKNLFRANLGIPLPLLLIKEEADKLYNIIYDDSDTKSPKVNKKDIKKKKEKNNNIKCIGNNLFDHLIDLQRNSKKHKKQTKKRKLKLSKRKTKKNLFF